MTSKSSDSAMRKKEGNSYKRETPLSSLEKTARTDEILNDEATTLRDVLKDMENPWVREGGGGV